MKRFIPAIKIVSFVLVLTVMLVWFTGVYERKSIYDSWDYTNKMNGFYNLPEDSVDMIGFGSSHIYCSLNPETAEKNGCSAYVLATQQQPVAATYHYMVEAFKTQSPKYVIFESFMLGGEGYVAEDAVLFDAITPLKFSKNKLDLINAVTEGHPDKEQFYLTLIKYHSRWDDLTVKDYTYTPSAVIDEYRGYVHLEDVTPAEKPTLPENITASALCESDIEYLEMMRELCFENSAEFIVATAPYPNENDAASFSRYLGVKAYCEENGIRYFDGIANEDDMMLDYETDFYDGGHFNTSGSAKFTNALIDFLEQE